MTRSQRCLAVLALILSSLVAGDALAIDQAVVEAEQNRVAVVAQGSPAGVAIFSPGRQGGGSGALILPAGYGLTNFYVTQGPGNFITCALTHRVLYVAL